MPDAGVDIDHGPPVTGADLQLSLQASPGAVRHALLRLRARLERRYGTGLDLGRVELVMAEILNNIVAHAYAHGGGPIDLAFCKTGARLAVEVRDRGCPFPRGAPPGSAYPAAETLPEGGFGWALIHDLTQGLDYARMGDVNRLTFTMPFVSDSGCRGRPRP